MKVRLKITSPAGDTTTFEHAGPAVRIGRDAQCELRLEGGNSVSVSREHARIDLAGGRAVVADLGSSNGTLLNDTKITGPRPLRAGDRIQLGYTGPTITVLDLDLAEPVLVAQPVAARPASRAAGPLVAAAGVFGVAAMVLLVLVLRQRPAPAEDTAATTAAPAPAPLPSPVKPLPPPIPPVQPTPPATIAKADNKKPEATPKPEAAPEDDPEVPVGTYVSLKEMGPSVLLERRGEASPWARLRPEADVVSTRALLCLPGYRAHVSAKRGVDLTLWGNVPEFCSVPPTLLESVVMLNASEDVDLDFYLVRGRVQVANTKKSGKAVVRLRYLRQVWELTLPDAESEAVAELWGALRPPTREGGVRSAPMTLGLFTKGHVTLRTGEGGETIDLPDRSRVSRPNEPNAKLYRAVQAELPKWWTQPPVADAQHPREADVMISLFDWSKQLWVPGNLAEEVFNRCGPGRPNAGGSDKEDATYRSLGVYFIGAFDLKEMPLVVQLLEDPTQTRVRRAAAHTLRAWLARDVERNAEEMAKMLRARISPPKKAADVQALLFPFPDDAVRSPEGLSRLARGLTAQLEDGNIAVRDLAAWHLEELARGLGIQQLPPFDAGAPAEARSQVVQQWKRLFGSPRATLAR